MKPAGDDPAPDADEAKRGADATSEPPNTDDETGGAADKEQDQGNSERPEPDGSLRKGLIPI